MPLLAWLLKCRSSFDIYNAAPRLTFQMPLPVWHLKCRSSFDISNAASRFTFQMPLLVWHFKCRSSFDISNAAPRLTFQVPLLGIFSTLFCFFHLNLSHSKPTFLILDLFSPMGKFSFLEEPEDSVVNAQRLLQYCQLADKRFPLYFKVCL